METGQGATEFSAAFGDVLRRLRKRRGRKQIEVAVDIPVDHSLVSRWETGSVLPTARDLDELRKILHLNEEEADELEYAWRRDRSSFSQDEHVGENLRTVDDWIGFLRVSIECVRNLRKSGQPRLAMVLGRRDALNAFDHVRATTWSAGHFQALHDLSELLLEECKAGLDYLPGSAVRAGELQKTLRMQDLAANGSGKPIARLLHGIAKEGVAYVAGNLGQAHDLGLSLLHEIDQIPPEWIPEVIRACGINSGKLGTAETLQLAEQALSRLLTERDDLPAGTHAFVLEGVARGWGGIDPVRAMGEIEKAWLVRESSEDSEGNSSLRYVQLVRSQAEVELALRTVENRNDILRKIETALTISERERYDKYVLQMKKLGDRLS